MAKPVLVIVDDEEASRQELARELESRYSYSTHYRIEVSLSPELALAWLREFRAEGVAVPLVLAERGRDRLWAGLAGRAAVLGGRPVPDRR